MERTKKEKNFTKIFNRGLSYLFLIFAIFATCYSVKKIADYSIAKKENKDLAQHLAALKETNQKLEITNTKLKDKNYFSVYVKDRYQYSSNDDSITPIN